MSQPVITRIAPSPTGHMHLGTVRTALFNYLYAKQNNGSFILRIEDTDKDRSKKEYEAPIFDGFTWLGITPDNTYRQSEHRHRHTKLLTKLLETDAAYVSRETSKKNPETTVDVVRLRNPGTAIIINDMVRGEITFDTTELGDFVIARSIDDPLYHFAVVVDDNDEQVSHIIRAEEHISNTPRQILIQEALGFTQPQYAHIPLILAPDRSKLSKRHGAVSLIEYREAGFLPEAVINYLALLGWNPGTEQEIFTINELVAQFSLADVQKGGAIFDHQKFLWINKQHLAKRSNDDWFPMVIAALPERVKKLPQYSRERLTRLLPTITERAHVTEEITVAAEAGEYDFAFAAPIVSVELLKWKNDPSVAAALPRLEQTERLLENADFTAPESIKQALWSYAETEGKGEVLWPTRVALTGRDQSPDPFTVAYILGPEETLARLAQARATIKAQ